MEWVFDDRFLPKGFRPELSDSLANGGFFPHVGQHDHRPLRRRHEGMRQLTPTGVHRLSVGCLVAAHGQATNSRDLAQLPHQPEGDAETLSGFEAKEHLGAAEELDGMDFGGQFQP